MRAWNRAASQVARVTKNLPAKEETGGWVPSLGWEDPLEKGMATHSSILAWESHGHSSLAGCVGLDMTEHTHAWDRSCFETARTLKFQNEICNPTRVEA